MTARCRVGSLPGSSTTGSLVGAAAAAGAVMEGFSVIQVLGSGSFSRALLCRDCRGEEVVVKEINCEDRKALVEAKSEADLMSQHEHSNICRYIASFADEAQAKFYLVMEYADGGDLAGAIARRREAGRDFWPEADAMSIFVMCLLAIRHVHSRRIVHRDIKAANVFLTKAGVVKLGDFGVSTILEGRAGATVLAKTQVGTPYYLSPEIFDGQSYGRKSDVWSLGVLLYEVLALRVPFEARSMVVLCRLVTGKKDPKPLPSFYGDDAAKLVRWLMTRDPDRRPSADAVLRDSDYVRCHTGQEKAATLANFKGSYLGRFPLVSAAFSTSDHLTKQSRSLYVFSWNARAEHPHGSDVESPLSCPGATSRPSSRTRSAASPST